MAIDTKDAHTPIRDITEDDTSTEAVAINEFRKVFGSGAIPTSEQRYYDPEKLHNDWSSVGRLISRPTTWARRMTSPAAMLFLAGLVILAVVNYTIFTANTGSATAAHTSTTTSNQTSTQTSVAGVPDATETNGNQLAKYTSGL